MLQVMRPKLPNTDQLLPYLRRIDVGRIYSNFGPLTIEFQNRLSDHFGMPQGCVAAASSGTTALIAAIMATGGPASQQRPFALVPAFTFAATAIAAERCGYRVYLADVDACSWMLDPQQLFNHSFLDRIGIVIPVAPFGRPVVQAPWHEFRERTGVPVVIDAAASFDCLGESPAPCLGDVPVVLSFHATKSFGTGEGGCIISTDISLMEQAAQALNFGFWGARDSRSASINGKMSEYHAAVGQAELDGWAAKQAAWQAVVESYRHQLSNKNLLSRFFTWPNISGCYALFLCLNNTEANRVQRRFGEDDIDFRFWYGTGLHRQTHFSDRPRDLIEVTEDIGERLIGVPIAPDLSEEAMSRVAAALGRAANEEVLFDAETDRMANVPDRV
jgi:dTDP-4-amino-4,6-dideoxygalactose transaminase